jgi:hypothetical protein
MSLTHIAIIAGEYEIRPYDIDVCDATVAPGIIAIIAGEYEIRPYVSMDAMRVGALTHYALRFTRRA